MRGKVKFIKQIIADYMKLVELGAKQDTLDGLMEYYHWRATK